MILTIAVVLTALGFVSWLAGVVFDFTGLAVIGGVLVVGVGAAVTTGGLQYSTGTATAFQYDEHRLNATVTNESVSADHGNYTDLFGSRLYNGSETVYYVDEGLLEDPWVEAQRGTDYEMNYTHGSIRTLSGGDIDDGEEIKVSYTFIDRNAVVETNATTENQYVTIEGPRRLPIGVLWMLFGSVLVFRGFTETT